MSGWDGVPRVPSGRGFRVMPLYPGYRRCADQPGACRFNRMDLPDLPRLGQSARRRKVWPQTFAKNRIIEEHREALRKIAEALLEHETIEGVHIHEILEHGDIRSPIEKIRDNADKGDEEEPDEEKKRKTSDDKPKDGGELATDTAPAPA